MMIEQRSDDDFNKDDAADDAMAAYREAQARANGEEVIQPAPDTSSGDRQQVDGGADRGTVRDRGGRFASTKTQATVDKAPDKATVADPAATGDKAPADVKAEAKPDAEVKPDAAAAVVTGPPSSWSVKAKAEWDKLPEHVRADIARRETDMASGLAALRDYKDLKPYAEMAQQHGTTIHKALEHFVNMENLIKRDIGAGLAFIAQNSGLNQQQAAALFSGLAQKFGGPAPAQGGQPANGAAIQPGDPLLDMLRPILQPLTQQISELKGSITSREQADRNAQQETLGKALASFATDPANRFFPDLEGTIADLFEKGMVPLTGNHAADLKAAYDLAARMHPEVHEALIEQRLATQKDAERKREQEAAEKARAASRSMSGSRAPGVVIRDVADNGADGPDDIEADVRRAMGAVRQA